MINLCMKSNDSVIAVNINTLLTACFYIANTDKNEPDTSIYDTSIQIHLFYVIRPVNLNEVD